jgi:hypothetical protein
MRFATAPATAVYQAGQLLLQLLLHLLLVSIKCFAF